MADVSVQLGKFIKKIEKLIDRDVSSREMLARLGKEVSARIQKRTRLGYGVPANNAAKESLKAMRKHSPVYAEFRAKNPGKLSGLTNPGKHNLTLTGKMLSDIRTILVDTKRKTVEIGFTDDFSLLKANVNSKRGWKFMHLSDIEIKSVNNFYKREVAKLVRESK
jgi:hypothetical protein